MTYKEFREQVDLLVKRYLNVSTSFDTDEADRLLTEVEGTVDLFLSEDKNLNELFSKIPREWMYDDDWTSEDFPTKSCFVYSYLMAVIYSKEKEPETNVNPN